MGLTTCQEILKYDCRFTIYTPQSLFQILGDLAELRYVFIEHFRMLTRDGLEHSCKAGVFPERITI